MYAQICDCNINLNLVAKDISQFSNAAAAYAPRRRHRRHRKAQHNAQSQRHSDCVQKIMENLMECTMKRNLLNWCNLVSSDATAATEKRIIMHKAKDI